MRALIAPKPKRPSKTHPYIRYVCADCGNTVHVTGHPNQVVQVRYTRCPQCMKSSRWDRDI